MTYKFFIYNSSDGNILIALPEIPENASFATDIYLIQYGRKVVSGLSWAGKSAFYNSDGVLLPGFTSGRYKYNSETGNITENDGDWEN